MTYYAITKGDYSDYHICAITTDRDKAERLKKIYTTRYDKAEIEEYREADEDSLKERTLWEYDVARNMIAKMSFGDPNCEGIFSGYYPETKDIKFVRVLAPDAEHARKKAYDMIAKRKAELAGI